MHGINNEQQQRPGCSGHVGSEWCHHSDVIATLIHPHTHARTKSSVVHQPITAGPALQSLAASCLTLLLWWRQTILPFRLCSTGYGQVSWSQTSEVREVTMSRIREIRGIHSNLPINQSPHWINLSVNHRPQQPAPRPLKLVPIPQTSKGTFTP